MDVRVMIASISESNHMLIAPAAPEPRATASSAMAPISGLIGVCVTLAAAMRPAAAVKTTSIMMRGFIRFT